MHRTAPCHLLPFLLLALLLLPPPPLLAAVPARSGAGKTVTGASPASAPTASGSGKAVSGSSADSASSAPSAASSSPAAPTPAAAGETGAATQWIVLPQQAHPSLQPSANAEAATLGLHYPQVISGQTDVPSDHDAAWVGFDRQGRRYYLPVALLVRRVEKPADSANLPIGREKVDRWIALPLDYRASDLVALDRKWDYYTDKRTLLLRREAAQAAERMLRDAEDRGGVHLRVVSSFRSAETQRSLYLDKVAKAGQGQRLVAKPGHSEHQLGTVMDLCAADGKKELQAEFGNTPEGKWLRENAGRFGFRLSFTETTTAATGYDPEPWHVRYLGEAARAE